MTLHDISLSVGEPGVPALDRLRLLAADPGVRPNGSGLPGLPVVRQIVGALLTWGLLACVAGLVISVMVWALAHHSGNYHQAGNC